MLKLSEKQAPGPAASERCRHLTGALNLPWQRSGEMQSTVIGATGCPARQPFGSNPAVKREARWGGKLPPTPLDGGSHWGCSCVRCVSGRFLSCPRGDAGSLHPSRGISAICSLYMESRWQGGPRGICRNKRRPDLAWRPRTDRLRLPASFHSPTQNRAEEREEGDFQITQSTEAPLCASHLCCMIF